ncbi:MAG: efflux RND transporter permease subunit, partial [Candidatus Kuenenia sp.]|nr:efflux RND transporter permease subunit [Candidatus Kuenenia sp.]
DKKIKSIQEIRETIVLAGTRRIRPAVMTSATTFIGLMPILWSTGAGAEIAKPMAIPSVGGMTMAMIVFFMVPCLNAWIKERKFKKELEKNPEIAEEGIVV